MNLYSVETVECVGYDEYDGIVVAAVSECAALEEARAYIEPYYTLEIRKISDSSLVEAGVILKSFNAG